MPITQLDTEVANRNITAPIVVLTNTPSATVPVLCQGLICFGDGALNLSGAGGNFTLVVTVGGQTIQPSPEVIVFAMGVPRAAIWTTPFPVPPGAEVTFTVQSPNPADANVNVAAYLYDVGTSATSALTMGYATEVETGVTLAQALARIAAILGGLIGGAGSGVETFRAMGQPAGGTTRAVVTVDANGNRTGIAYP